LVNFFVEGDGFEVALLFFGVGVADGVTTFLLSIVFGEAVGVDEGSAVGLTAGVGVGSGVGELVTISVGGLTVGSLLAFSLPLEQLVAKNRMLAVSKRDFPSIGRVVRKLFTLQL
jgi:hypothetical protein